MGHPFLHDYVGVNLTGRLFQAFEGNAGSPLDYRRYPATRVLNLGICLAAGVYLGGVEGHQRRVIDG